MGAHVNEHIARYFKRRTKVQDEAYQRVHNRPRQTRLQKERQVCARPHAALPTTRHPRQLFIGMLLRYEPSPQHGSCLTCLMPGARCIITIASCLHGCTAISQASSLERGMRPSSTPAPAAHSLTFAKDAHQGLPSENLRDCNLEMNGFSIACRWR